MHFKTIAVDINRQVILIFHDKTFKKKPVYKVVSFQTIKLRFMKYNTQLSNSAQSLNTDSKNQLK